MTYHYRAYGLSCFSDTLIPGFLPGPASPGVCPDIFLELSPEPPEWVRAARRLPERLLYRKPLAVEPGDSTYTISSRGFEECFELTYGDGTEFVIESSGKRLWGSCPPPHSISYLATYLRGPIMGFILRRRGVIALHASALSFFGQAVVLCGASQSGKSTTAAALALRGTPVLCDDITPLRVSGDAFYVEPGYSHLGLWPDAVQNLLGAPDALPRWTPSWEKCFLELDGKRAEFEKQPQSLSVIYLLAPRSRIYAPRIERVGRRQALLELVKNTYMNWLLDRHQRAAEFDLLAKLVMRVPVRRIVAHVDTTQIPTLCDLIPADAKALLPAHDEESLLASR